MNLQPWSSSVHRLAALNFEIERREAELAAMYAERDKLAWELENGDHTE